MELQRITYAEFGDCDPVIQFNTGKVRKVMSMYAEEKNSKAVYLPIENVRPNPYQPRREMCSEALADLCASIKQYGLMQPMVVRQMNDRD